MMATAGGEGSPELRTQRTPPRPDIADSMLNKSCVSYGVVERSSCDHDSSKSFHPDHRGWNSSFPGMQRFCSEFYRAGSQISAVRKHNLRRQHGAAARQDEHHLGLVRSGRPGARRNRWQARIRNSGAGSPLAGKDAAADRRRTVHSKNQRPSDRRTSQRANWRCLAVRRPIQYAGPTPQSARWRGRSQSRKLPGDTFLLGRTSLGLSPYGCCGRILESGFSGNRRSCFGRCILFRAQGPAGDSCSDRPGY